MDRSFDVAPPAPSNAITLPETNALRGLGDWLACGDPDKLSPEVREHCAKRDLGLPQHKDEGLAFIVKAIALIAGELVQWTLKIVEYLIGGFYRVRPIDFYRYSTEKSKPIDLGRYADPRPF